MEQTNQHHGILQSLLLLMELQLDHSPVIHTFPCTDILIGLCPCKGKKKPKQTYTWEFSHWGSGSIRIINAVSILAITLNKKNTCKFMVFIKMIEKDCL